MKTMTLKVLVCIVVNSYWCRLDSNHRSCWLFFCPHY